MTARDECVGIGEEWHDAATCAVCSPPLTATEANARLHEIRAVMVTSIGDGERNLRRRIAMILDREIICRYCDGTLESCTRSKIKCCPDCTHGKSMKGQRK